MKIDKNNAWIEWGGGERPVDSDAIVEVKYRKPNPYQYNNDRAGDFAWAHDGIDGDIIAYRLQHPGFKSRANDDRLEQDLNECIGQDFDVVNHPSHYTQGDIECIDAIKAAQQKQSGLGQPQKQKPQQQSNPASSGVNEPPTDFSDGIPFAPIGLQYGKSRIYTL